ncbi:MAG TPA: SUMF1/EgtB/PvdO family nonheme iron enzyme [Nitrospira sp.]|nr:SUMF1/EgtB/PvdO family nonheme iron enzyme [Nitrospira sp.]
MAHALERRGWAVWWDRRIRTGGAFDEVIQKALAAAKSVVVVWTDNSIKSTWVKNEARKGMRRGLLFPVMLLQEVEIPLEFEHLQAAHLMDWQPEQDHAGFEQFIDDLTEVIGAPVNSVVHPPPVPHLLHEPSASLTSELSFQSKAADDGEPVRAIRVGNNNLSALTVALGSLSPVFSSNILNYMVNVDSNVKNVIISATKADSNAVISGDVSAGAGIGTGQATIQLSGPGTTTSVTIWVTAPGGAQKTYMLRVSRAALSGNNNLQSVSISPGTLAPSFSANGTAYTVNVGNSSTSVTITPMLQDENSSITINGQATGSGQARAIPLGSDGTGTEIGITVIAPNGSEKTYRIRVNRAAFPEVAEMEQDPARYEQQLPATVTRAVSQDSSVAAPSITGAPERAKVDSGFAPAAEDRLNESIGVRQSTNSFPYLPIGLGLLFVMGALVYFLIFLQSPSSGPREMVQYQPSVQSPTTQSEVIISPPAPEPKQPAATATPGGPAVMQGADLASTITGNDRAPMVLVPAGEFIMGSQPDDKNSDGDEQPAHPLDLDAFYIDQYEVTTSQYAKFLGSTNRSEPMFWPVNAISLYGRKPVVGVDWNDADAYCSWAGKYLPTEAQWEKAARGTDRRQYPWGNVEPSEKMANFGATHSVFLNYQTLADVGSFGDGKSPYDVYDMAGNVMEWTADWYGANYYRKSPHRNPKGPSSGLVRVIRGGSWDIASVALRSANRFRTESTNQLNNVGFRCVQDVSN